MSYIRDGYVFVSASNKVGRKGYGHVGQCVFLIGKSKRAVTFKHILFPQIYWGKRIRLKVEVIEDHEGTPCKGEFHSEKDIENIKIKAYQEGYRKGKTIKNWIDKEVKNELKLLGQRKGSTFINQLK